MALTNLEVWPKTLPILHWSECGHTGHVQLQGVLGNGVFYLVISLPK